MNKLLKGLLAIALASVSSITLSEDIELYISDVVRQAGKSTKVLIIFDNSGSMGTLHKVSDDFDPTKNYEPEVEGSAHAYTDVATYFNKGGADNSSAIPAHHNDARRFLGTINGCESSKAILAEFGFYTGRIREYTYRGNNGSWDELPDNNGLNITVLDCEDDAYIEDSEGTIVNEGSVKNDGTLPEGYPVNNKGTNNAPIYHDATKTTTNVDWSSGGFVTLYTAKYLRWFHGQSVDEVTESRMETAQKSMISVINTTPSIDFGLEIFNYNDGDGVDNANGGRITLGIKEMTDTNKASIIDMINEKVSPSTWTPLCESVYEASQYFAGAAVEFGNDDKNSGGYVKNKPPSIISSGNYTSPFNNCSSSIAHIILVTDGEPTYDFGADAKIEALSTMVPRLDEEGFPVFDDTGNPVFDSKLFDGTRYTEGNSNSYLPALAGWMSNYDINPTLDGEQTVATHTIGFSSGAAAAEGLLRETAIRGKGEFFHANTGLQLTQALIKILNKLPQSNDSLTSASVAANNFDSTQTLDSVYYSMFEPQTGARWQGNLKKYKVVGKDLEDVNEKIATCEVSGRRSFCDTSQSFWSSSVDGDHVGKGGVASWFAKKVPADRTLYLDAGVGSLISYDRTNLEAAFTDAAGLATELGVAGLVDKDGNSIESAAINDLLAWSMGQDVDNEDKDPDGDTLDMRQDVFGDPLHSKPLVVNYGGTRGIRIVVGTNAGALHMFEDSGNSVKENWAFMPKEFIRNIKTLRENYSTANKVYGIDGEITVHLDDKDGNGIIEGSDTAWIFFGLRRGGSSYYALDISDPDSAPKLLWHIDNSSPGFSSLGQSWAKPKVGYSKLNTSGSIASPVLFIGGGYDTNKDSSGLGSNDDKGNAIYMLNAKTGGILWSLAPTDGTTTFAGTDSIPSAIGILDSTGNGLVDRLYAGDTGGNVWRVDMPGDDKNKFSVFKLASLGSDTDNSNDQRFFYEPTIVRTFISEIKETTIDDGSGGTKTITVHQDIPYDAVLIGSGDRASPLNKDTKNTLYMIKDSNILTQQFPTSSVPPVAAPATLVIDDLYKYTDNPFSGLTTQEEEDLQVKVSKKSGWYIDLLQSGEKNSAEGLVINNIAYFTSYTPASFATLIDCKPPEGAGWLYAVDLALGVRKHTETDVRDDDIRVIKINNDWLGPPTLIVLPEDDGDEDTVDDAQGDIIVGDLVIDANFTLATSRTYLYSREKQ